MDRLSRDELALHVPRMYRVALRMLGDRDAAEEVAQEASLRALASASRFDSRASLATWLHRITVNCAPDRLRVLGREAADPAALAGQSAWAPLPPDLAAQQACRPHAQLRGRPASPKVSLNLADVSDDNLPAKIESPWSVPFPDDAIRSMDKRCLAAVGDARGPSSRAIHVRLPAVKNASKSRWSEPAALVMRDSR